MRTNPIKRILPVLAAAVVLLASCEKEYISFGSDFVDNNTTNIVYLDSATVALSTVYVDSFISSNTGSILAGRYADPQFGTTTSTSFVQLGAPGTNSIPSGATFDSVQLILRLNRNFYGDTLVPFNIAVHQLSQTLVFPSGQYQFYNNQTAGYDPSPLASKQFMLRPSIDDSIVFRMPQALGQDLFDKMKSSSSIVTDNDEFLNYFKGLAFVAPNNSMVLGFKDSVILRLHYRVPDVIDVHTTADLTIYDKTHQFNHIQADRTGTPLATIGPSNREIPSAALQNNSYSQYLSGVMTKVRFPYLRNLLQLNNFVKIVKADLVLKPLNASYLGNFSLPPKLELSTTDQYNGIGYTLGAYDANTGSTDTQYGNLVIDGLYGTATAYTYDVTAYLQQQIAISLDNKNGVLVIPDEPATVLNRVIFGDGKNTQGKAQLKIYYAAIK